jgi:hypothetical protein
MPVHSRNYSLDASTFEVVLGPRSCTGTLVQLSRIYSASLYTLIVTEKRIYSAHILLPLIPVKFKNLWVRLDSFGIEVN